MDMISTHVLQYAYVLIDVHLHINSLYVIDFSRYFTFCTWQTMTRVACYSPCCDCVFWANSFCYAPYVLLSINKFQGVDVGFHRKGQALGVRPLGCCV